MKRKITFLSAALMLFAFLAVPLGMWGQTKSEVVAYTLDGTQTGGSSGYATESEITQNDITWMVTANTTINPWRFGGKSIDGVDRPMYSTDPIAENVTKVVINNGTANLTVNSMTLIVSANADFSNPTSTLIGEFAASSVTIFERPTDVDWTNQYFKVIYNVTNTQSSNKYAQLISAEFYKEEGSASSPSISAENVGIAYDAESGEIEYTINNPADDGELTANVTEGNWLNVGNIGDESVQFTCSANTAGTPREGVITLTYTYGDEQTVNKNVTIIQAGNPNATMTIAEVRAQGTGSVATVGTVTSCVGVTGYIQDNTAAICVYGTQLTVGDEIRVSGTLSTYNGLLEITSPEVTVLSSGNTIQPQLMTVEEAVESSNQGWYIRFEGVTVTAISGQNTTVSQDGSSIVVRGISSDIEYDVNDILSLNGNIGHYNSNNQIANPQNVEVQENPSTEPSITVTPATVSVNAEEHDGTLALDYENLTITDMTDFEIQYYDANEVELTEVPDWIEVLVAEQDPEFGEGYVVSYYMLENEGEARTAYFKVYAMDDETNLVYSNLVTINQAEYVAPALDYAELPFEFNGGKADIEGTDGLTAEGLGSDYNANNNPTTKLKFDSTDDWMILHFIETPDTLQFNIKGNSFSGGTFTVQTSEDGVTYTDLKSYTDANFGNELYSEEFTNLGENVRYIKWIYTEKASGNVGLGNIMVSEYEEPVLVPSITLDEYTINVEATSGDGIISVVYENFTALDPHVQLYDADGAEVEPEYYQEWISVFIGYEDDNVHYGYEANTTTEDRTVYFKVYNGEVYSELATITQAGIVAPEPPTEGWVLTSLAELTEDDVFVIVGNNGSTYAMSNNNGTSSAPAAVEVTIENDALTQEPDTTIQWTLNITENGYNFYPYGETETWLFCNNGNNGVRVGTDSNNLFVLDETTGYLKNVATSRYLGIYNSQDWRCYTNTTGNIANQTFAFYKKVAEPAPVASITFDPDSLIFDAELHYDGTMPFTYENIIVESMQSFGLQFYTAEGEETGMPEWFYAMVTPRSNENNGEYQVSCATMANEGEARSVYFKVYAFDADSIPVYSNLATVTQTAPVYDYVILPFVWEGGSSADFLALNGVTANGLGNDYASGNAPYLIKFDGTGDYIQVKTDSQPGMVTINVKMIGGSNTSTITIQGSADGENFTDIDTLTISGSQNDELTLETTNAFDANDRYVRMLFTKGSNVGVGPITITKGTVPSITLTPDIFELEAVGPLNGMHLPSMMVYCHNLEIAQASDFNYQFYNAEGEEQEMPEWILHSEVSLITETGYQAICIVTANNGPARSAYFKVYAFDADSIPVYSNLVTFNQAAALPSITVTPENMDLTAEQHYIANESAFTINYENIVDSTYQSFTIHFYDGVEGEEIPLGDTPWHVLGVTGTNDEGYQVVGYVTANEGDARTAYFKVSAQDANGNTVYSNLVTINQAAYEAPAETWVLTDFADLTEGDVFVIVGDNGDTYAMPNDNGTSSAPVAVAIDVVNGTLSEAPAANLQWNLSRQGNSYTFYPNGDAENWLYCTNTNNGVRVGGTNVNNAFVLDESGYLMHVFTSRYIGIYNSQDWRCYTNTTGNIAGQTFSFYKKVVEPETYTLDITGYGNNAGGYYLIASPVYVNPETTGMTQGDFDLYYFDQNQDEEWRNYEANHFNLVPGKGYLYAHKTDTTLTFTGTPYSGDGTVKLVKNDNAVFAGWNLVGNPFGEAASIDRDYYTMDETGSEIIAAETGYRSVMPMQGIFVIADDNTDVITFSTETGTVVVEESIVVNVTNNRRTIDRAIVRFGEGRQLPKFQLNENSTKLYIPQGNNDFAVVRSATQSEMPVNFKAAQEGTYTLSINTENVEMDYLFLIDNMTGAEVDLLQTPSYTFEANTNDYSNRFRLVFSANGVADDTTSTESFAFFNGSEWVVSNIGKATLQMVDLTGRILSSESISGNATVSTANLSTGVYMMRLVQGNDTKVQKMVIR